MRYYENGVPAQFACGNAAMSLTIWKRAPKPVGSFGDLLGLLDFIYGCWRCNYYPPSYQWATA
jgi:hypothetical protein